MSALHIFYGLTTFLLVMSLLLLAKWKKVQTRSPYTLCYHCRRPMSKLTRVIRIDMYCSRRCRKIDVERIDKLAIDRLMHPFGESKPVPQWSKQ
jgi:hypothetical protein